MATSFGGFIASALGGAAQGYGEGAQMEMKKQAELDLKKQMLDAETEKALRIDEITSGRIKKDRLEEEARLRSPAYLEAQATAAAAKFDAFIKAGVPEAEARALVRQGTVAAGTRESLAPVNAKADVVVAKADVAAKTELIPTNQALAIAMAKSEAEIKIANAPGVANADAAAVLAKADADAKSAPNLVKFLRQQYDATKEFVKDKAKDLTEAKAAELKALVDDTEYMKALKTQNSVLHQHLLDVANINAAKDVKVAEIRANSSDERTEASLEIARLKRLADANKPAKAPGGGTPNASLELERAEKSAEKALARALNVEPKEANSAYGALKKKADGGDATAKAKLVEITPMKNRLEAASAEWEARKKATSAAPAASAPAAAASGAVPAMPPNFKGVVPAMPPNFKGVVPAMPFGFKQD